MKKYSLDVEIILADGTREKKCVMIASLLKCKVHAKVIKKIHKEFMKYDPIYEDSELFIFINEMELEK